MLRKWNRFLAVIIAIAMIATTFNSNVANIRVYADDRETEEFEAPAEEPVVEEPEAEEPEEEPVIEGEPEQDPPVEGNIEEDAPAQDPPEEDAPEQDPPAEDTPAQDPPAEEVIPAEDGTPAEVIEPEEEVIPEDEIVPEEEEVIPEKEEKLIVISYIAAEGGKVSISSEEVDLNAEEIIFLGATAEAEDGYIFVKWTDADGNEVSADATFVPAGLDADASFTAVFEAVEEEEEVEPEQKLVKVTYKAAEGGKVSRPAETIDILAEDARFEGATAEPLNEAFAFVNWINEDGEEVSADPTFVPENIEADAVFTAVFEETEAIVNYPPISADNVHAGGLIVSVNADSGAFPEGTEVKIRGISEGLALATAKSELGEDVTGAVGVDISFYYEGSEIQPAADSFVHVSLEVEKTIEGTDFTVLHDHDGSVEQISASIDTVDANSDPEDDTQVVTSVDFSVNEFSIFIVAAQDQDNTGAADEHRVVTYKFYLGTTLFNEQSLIDGEELKDPGIPLEVNSKQKFLGWYVDGEKLTFPYKVSTASYTEEETIKNVYASVQTTYYVSFVDTSGSSDRVVFVKEAKAHTDENGQEVVDSITVDDITVSADSAEHKAFAGWATERNNRNTIITGNSLTVTGDMEVYAIIVEAYYIYFNENDAETGGGASYTSPIFVEYNNAPSSKKPDDPTRKGYDFGGWYTSATTQTEATAFDWDKNIQESITSGKEITLYAKWTEKVDTNYTIIVWKQKITDTVGMSDADKDYDYGKSYVKQAKTNAEVTVSGSDSAKVKVGPSNVYDSSTEGAAFYNGFHYARYTVVNGSGNTTNVVGNKGDTVINIYYDRNEMTITFGSGSGKTYQETTDTSVSPIYGKYGSTYVVVYYNESAEAWGYDGYSGFHSINEYTRRYGQGDGKLYKEVSANVFKGLYGQRLFDCGYTWPSGNWYENNGTHLTFLDAFIFDGLDTDDAEKTKLTLKTQSLGSTPYTVEFWKRSVDGSEWFKSEGDTQKYSGNWNITDKYSGFKYIEYSTDGGASWKSDTLKISAGDIKLRYERLKYDLVFMYNGETVGIQSEVYFETPLKNYSEYAEGVEAAINSRYASNANEQYAFVGWYEDQTLTKPIDLAATNQIMPVGGKTVYAKVAPLTYTIRLDPNGGTLKQGQDSVYPADWGDYLDKASIMATTKTADGVTYELVGWFWNNNGVAGDIYLFDTKVTSDVSLIAKWRNAGNYTVEYTADAEYGATLPSDNYKYALESTVRVLSRPSAFDDKYAFIGWQLLDKNGDVVKLYYPNDCFDMIQDLISNNKVTLKALFEEKGGNGSSTETTTYIYNANFGTYETTVPETVPINRPFIAKSFAETGLTAKPSAVFLGWSTVSSSTTAEIEPGEETTPKVAANNDGGAASNVLYAIWDDLVPVKYTVRHVTVLDGVETQRKTDDYSDSVPSGSVKELEITSGSLAHQTYAGYTFDRMDPTYTVGQKVPDKTTITIYYKPDPDRTYRVSYESENDQMGSVSPTADAEASQILGTANVKGSTATANEGYKFVGWYKNGAEISQDAELSEADAKANVTKNGNIYEATTYTAKFAVDTSKTYKVSYVPGNSQMGTVDPEEDEQESQILGTANVKGSIATANEGYKFVGWYKGNEEISTDAILSEADAKANVTKNGNVYVATTYTAIFEKDDSQTKPVEYTVNHLVDGKVKDTATYSGTVWVNDPALIEVTEESLAANDYTGYELTDIAVVQPKVEGVKAAGKMVVTGTEINLIYSPRTYTIRYEYRYSGNTKPDKVPALPAAFEGRYNEEFRVADLPEIEGFTLTAWAMEKDTENPATSNAIIDAFEKFLEMITGTITAGAADDIRRVPAYNAVIYTIISPKAAPAPEPEPAVDPEPAVEPEPTPEPAPAVEPAVEPEPEPAPEPAPAPEPTPEPAPEPTPDEEPAAEADAEPEATPDDEPVYVADATPIVDEPTPTAPEPVEAAPADPAAVLGATREQPTDAAAVLGARRGRTDDETTAAVARIFAMLMAAGAAIALLLKGKKKEDEA